MASNQIKILIGGFKSHQQMREVAYIDETVNKNWVSKKVALHLKLERPAPTKIDVAETWKDLQLRSIGVVGFSWSRWDVSNAFSFTTVFHVTEEETPHIIIGRDLLSKHSSIRDPKDSIHVLESTKQTPGNTPSPFPLNQLRDRRQSLD
ncbi:hypothetical protein MMC27_006919 [Xylographa pallens]|nr:hypothetical protein [Xylographa pallens]